MIPSRRGLSEVSAGILPLRCLLPAPHYEQKAPKLRIEKALRALKVRRRTIVTVTYRTLRPTALSQEQPAAWLIPRRARLRTARSVAIAESLDGLGARRKVSAASYASWEPTLKPAKSATSGISA